MFKKGVNTEPEGSEVMERDVLLISVNGEMVEVTADDSEER